MMISQEAILERVMQVVLRFVPLGTSIDPNTDLDGDLGLESITMMDVLADLEDMFDISIPINILMDVRTPAQLARKIVSLMEHKHGTV